MKTALTALAVVILAGAAAPAQAQPAGGDRMRDRAERLESRDRPQRDGASRDFGGGRRRDSDGGQPPRVREAPQAPTAPQAPVASEPRRGSGGDGVRGGSRGDGDRGDGVRGGRRGDGDGRRGDGDRNNDGRRDWNGDGRRGDGDRNNDGRRDWNGRGDNDHRGDRRDGDGRRDWDRRGDNDRRDWNGRGDRRDWDNRRHGDHRRWERGRYPSVYFSSHRYRHAWRAPVGFYVRSWAYGEFLPRSWFAPSYWIADPWRFDLPLPPPGFVWVRSGDDALLVDEYNGRIVQVVRNVFW